MRVGLKGMQRTLDHVDKLEGVSQVIRREEKDIGAEFVESERGMMMRTKGISQQWTEGLFSSPR